VLLIHAWYDIVRAMLGVPLDDIGDCLVEIPR